MIKIPRGDGQEVGSPRPRIHRTGLPQYVPAKLAERQGVFEILAKKGVEGFRKPGSQNPRSR